MLGANQLFLCITKTSCSGIIQAEDGIRDGTVTGVQTCALPIYFVGFKASEATFGKPSLVSPVLTLPNKHTRVIIDFKSGERLFFNDIRKFGWIRIVRNETMKQ